MKTLPEYSFAYRSERDLGTPDGLVPDRSNRHDRHNRLGRALLSGPALGNLDGSGDGSLEILAGAYDRHLYAWYADGAPVPGWPVLLKDPDKVAAVDPVTDEVTLKPGSGAPPSAPRSSCTPALGDLDGDGRVEVVAAVNEEYVEPLNAVFENAVVNLFLNAGVLDGGNTRVYALHADGAMHGADGLERGWNPNAFVPGWPVKTAMLTTELLPLVGTGSNGSPALADVDGDGTLEVGTMSVVGPVYVFRHDGVGYFGRHPTGQDRTLESERFGAASNATDKPTFGGLGAVTLARFAGTAAGYRAARADRRTGQADRQPGSSAPVPGREPPRGVVGLQRRRHARRSPVALRLPHQVTDLQFLAGPSVADVTGDGLPRRSPARACRHPRRRRRRREAPGWPRFTNGWMVQGPAVGDLDGDGRLEVVATTREGHLFAWRTDGDECGAIPWRRWHHDEWSSSNAGTDARPPASLRPQRSRRAPPTRTASASPSPACRATACTAARRRSTCASPSARSSTRPASPAPSP
ncbi:MAG: hypothetical protein U0802_17645 [Candidatus Binatia bacterium]